MQFFIQNLIVGIAVGGIYALIALGFVLIYKSTGILNMAQGGLLSMGAFICFTLANAVGLPFILAVLLALSVSFLIGVFIDRTLFRPMIGQPLISAIMMTLALLFILDGAVISLWGAQYRKFPQVFPDRPILLGPFALSHELFFNFIIAGLLTLIFILFFRFSRIGTRMRAVACDQQAAQASGINVRKVFTLSWGIGTVIATFGGISLGMITMVFTGLSYSALKVLPVVILGGMESIPGAIAGGLIIGVLESLSGGYIDPYLKGSKEVTPYIVLIVFLVFKPYGLFGLKRIERI